MVSTYQLREATVELDLDGNAVATERTMTGRVTTSAGLGADPDALLATARGSDHVLVGTIRKTIPAAMASSREVGIGVVSQSLDRQGRVSAFSTPPLDDVEATRLIVALDVDLARNGDRPDGYSRVMNRGIVEAGAALDSLLEA